MSYTYVKSASPHPSQYPTRQGKSSSSSSSSSSSGPPIVNMSYHRGGSSHHHAHSQQPWTLAPAVPVASPPSASPFSPSSHSRPARNVTEIVPRLFISDLAFAENPALLSAYRVTHILSTLSDNVFSPPPSLLPNQPVRMHVRIEDLPFAELASHLPGTTAFIRNALSSSPDAKVLVHCGEGISRSVSVVAAYLMAQYNWTPLEAVHYIKSKRSLANPNFGFVQQLHEYARNSLGRVIPNPVPPFSTPS